MAATNAPGIMAATNAPELLRTAVVMVLNDDGFNILSEPARKSRILAKKYLEWCQLERNEHNFVSFSKELVGDVNACFTSLPTAKARREQMWERFFKYRASSEFSHKWISHLSAVEVSPTPIFYQFITDFIMEHFIKEHFPMMEQPMGSPTTLDFEEHNAIRYTAGYVLRAIRSKIDCCSNPLKVELALCLEELREEAGNSLSHASEEWLQAIDRGGLVHVNDITYMVLVESCTSEGIWR